MIWSASLMLALVAAIPVAVEARVREAIAARWRVATEAVTVDWGRLAATVTVDDSATIRLLGEGRDGRFVVSLRSRAGREIAVAIRAGHRTPAFVAARPLSSGVVLGADDVTTTDRLRWGPPPGPRAGTSPIGMETRRTLASGDLLEGTAVAPPVIITPGQTVRFVWEQAGIQIVREAVAQSQGRLGETVWGRDTRRGDRVAGVALGPGRARLIIEGSTR
ncbi:MAG: flagellar basal body P-ring formation chaperone FlgA [Gemmatimonadales bacterium]